MSTESSISRKKLNANRSNAQKSTGPRTEQGKARSSRNSISHGMYCANNIILPGENPSAFLLLRETYINSYRPQTIIELTLVEHLTTAQWKIERLHRLEQTRHELQADRMNRFFQDELERSKVDGHLDDSMVQYLEEQQDQQMTVAYVQTAQVGDKEEFAKVEMLSRHHQRLENSMYRAMRELDRLQKTRRENKEDVPSPYRSNQDELLELADEEQSNSRNEANEEDIDSNFSDEEELATDGPSLHPDTRAAGMTNRDMPPRANVHGATLTPRGQQ